MTIKRFTFIALSLSLLISILFSYPIYANEKEYTLTIGDKYNGQISVDGCENKGEFKEGEEITINLYPNEGYNFCSYSLRDKDGKEILGSFEEDSLFEDEISPSSVSFKMPNEDVTLLVGFCPGEEVTRKMFIDTYNKEGMNLSKDTSIEEINEISTQKIKEFYEKENDTEENILKSSDLYTKATVTRGGKIRYPGCIQSNWTTFVYSINGALAFCVDPNLAAVPNGAGATPILSVTGDHAATRVIGFGVKNLISGARFRYNTGIPVFYNSCHEAYAALGATDSGSIYALNHIFLSIAINKNGYGTNVANAAGYYNSLFCDDMDKKHVSEDSYYIIYSTGNGAYQRLAVGDAFIKNAPETIKVAVQKESSDPTYTNNYPNIYKLQDARFGVYDNPSCSGDPVAIITTDANGYGETGELNKGDYYIKEITAPQGYAINNTVYKVE